MIEFKDICKHFQGTTALDHVSFTAESGQITALLGQNGAGKSTLMKILTGAYQKDSGEIRIDGRSVNITDPNAAEALGIGIVYQELSGMPHLTVSENIVIGRDPVRHGFLDFKKQREIARQMLNRLGASDIDVDQRLGELSVSQQQICEIAKCMAEEPKIVVFDEPTTSLTNREKEKLFEIMNKMQEDGLTILFITHYLEDALQLCKSCVIMKDGRVAYHGEMASMTEQSIVNYMVSQSIDSFFPEYHSTVTATVALAVSDLEDTAVHGCSLELRYGEVLGLSGLIGAGRTELAHLLIGERKPHRGQILVDGQVCRFHDEYDAMRKGIAYINEDRRSGGLNLTMDVGFNLALSRIVMKRSDVVRRGVFVNSKAVLQNGDDMIEKLAIKCSGQNQKVSTLSGGNQQKVSIGKMVASGSKILIFDEPTKGIDVSAKAKVYSIIRELAAEGCAILVISSYNPELLGVCDRIAVMSRGKIVQTYDRGVTEETLLLAQQQG